jgi:hypothetical protein
MAKFGLVLILTMMAGGSYAQDYFILIRADHRQPFYVRIGGELRNSSGEGHLILSGMKDSTYNLTVGFPGQAAPEQRFSISMHQKDQELQLKDQGDKQWVLYDIQTQTEKTADKEGVVEGGGEVFKAVGLKKEDAFSLMMAGVVRDTAVLYNTYASQQVLMDSPVAKKPAVVTPAAVSQTDSAQAAASQAGIAQTGASNANVSQTGGVQAADSQARAAQTGAPQTSTPQSHASQTTVARTGVSPSGTDSALLRTDSMIAQSGLPGDSSLSHTSSTTPLVKAGEPLYRPIANSSAPLPDTAAEIKKVTDSGVAGRLVINKTDSFKVVGQTDSSLTLQSVSIIDTIAGRSPGTMGIPVNPAASSTTPPVVTSTAAAKVPVVPDTPAIASSTPPVTSSPASAPRGNVDSAATLGHADSGVAKGAAPLYRPTPKPARNSNTGPLYRPLGITKVSERKLPHSLRQVYADHSGGSKGNKADTIVVIIPFDTPEVVRGGSSLYRARPADTSRVTGPRSHGPNPDSPTVGQSTGYRTDAARNHSDIPPVRPDTPKKEPARPSLPYVNSDCHNFATDYDVDKLRVRMLESAQDDDRIAIARKVFKTRCFSTRQLRALSEVFTTDAAKFHFFEVAYPFAADDHFRDLAPLLADPAYNSKFKGMTGQ